MFLQTYCLCRKMIYLLAITFLLVSCVERKTSCLFSNYNKEVVNIKKDGAISELEDDDYVMKVEAYLSLPDSSETLLCDRMKYDGGYYFLLDNVRKRTIWVFDSLGNYVAKLGRKGRANAEYQNDITDWFYTQDSGNVFVFERNSQKIHKFSIEGESLETCQLSSWPNAIGKLEDEKSFCSYYHKMSNSGAQLCLMSNSEIVEKVFIDLKTNMRFIPTDNSFYVNEGHLFHVPSFADSSIVFNKDSVEKVVKFTFDEKFISEEIKEDAYNDNLDRFRSFDGIQYINTFYETSRFYYLKYSYCNIFLNHLVDKRSGKQYLFVSNPTKGMLPASVLCVRDNKIFFLITKQDVEDTRHLCDDVDLYRKELSLSNPLIQRIFEGEESLPLIFSIEIK